MLVDSYAPEDVFARVPDLAGHTDPVLVQLDRLLDDEALYQQVRADLGHRYPQTLVHGRHSTPAEVLLRLLVIKHLYRWSYQETIERVGDSLVLRWFTRMYFAHVPDATTLLRWAHTITPTTLEHLNDRIVHLAQQANVTHGRKLRLDGTTVQTSIHHPTDSGLLVDGVRVLTRWIRRARPLVETAVASARDTFRNRTRSVRRVARQIHRRQRLVGPDREAEQQQAYTQLLTLTDQVVQQAQRVQQALVEQGTAEAQRLRERLEEMLPLVRQVIHQTRQRVIERHPIPSAEKILSLFEPHTRVIPRLKAGAQVEFGQHVVLSEVEGGLITRWSVLDHASEFGELPPALEHHWQQFAHAPRLLAGDRGYHSEANRRVAQQQGIGILAIPWKGKPPPDVQAEHQTRRWKRAYRWRAGIEGRIHSLRRDYGLAKCRDHHEIGLQRAVGWGIMASNLRQIAKKLAA